MQKHYTIPIFIPEKACPFRCIYCNQYRISSTLKQPERHDVIEIIESYLQTLPHNAVKEIGFFGGSFTGMSMAEQSMYLETAFPYLQQGLVTGIRISTRPDYIDLKILDNLKLFGVKTIELGGQSLHEDVLSACNRGHTVKDVEHAAHLIKEAGFELGIQMMIGLPNDTFEKSLATAEKIVAFGAENTRIYPALVIKDTELADMFLRQIYKPLSLDEAISWTKGLVKFFDANRIKILRVGLHPTQGLIQGSDLLAGPFHVSFKELVLTEIWNDILSKELQGKRNECLIVKVNPKQLNAAIGYGGKNKKVLQQSFKKVSFQTCESLQGFEKEVEIFGNITQKGSV